MDKERRSPLLLAASRSGWRTVLVLIRLGADIQLKDANHRNVLHLVVMNGGRLEEFAAEVIKVIFFNKKIKIKLTYIITLGTILKEAIWLQN